MSGRRAAIRHSAVATGKGDDGTTGLLFGGPRRVAKDDPRTEAYGTIDEAVAALGVARAELDEAAEGTVAREIADLILRLQRELFVVGAELATDPAHRDRLEDGISRVSEAMLDGLETTLSEVEARVTMPREFVVPGETRLSAVLELARAVLRRAERRAVALTGEGSAGGEWLLPYVNRLADLLWVLARFAEQSESRNATPSRTPSSRP
jgi:cob(I)alamin adenosyltransferase